MRLPLVGSLALMAILFTAGCSGPDRRTPDATPSTAPNTTPVETAAATPGCPAGPAGPAAPGPLDISQVLGHWQRGGLAGGADVFRWVDAGRELPVARFRAGMGLEPNGVFTYRVLAPNDAHFWAKGSYTFREGVVEGTYEALGRENVVRYRVCSSSKGELVLLAVTPPNH
ncbi:MAG: hypothetical protein ACI9MR_001720 [Myxococcota bacterium]|jgi:hypothetical protein